MGPQNSARPPEFQKGTSLIVSVITSDLFRQQELGYVSELQR